MDHGGCGEQRAEELVGVWGGAARVSGEEVCAINDRGDDRQGGARAGVAAWVDGEE